jgi:hypothetical protein
MDTAERRRFWNDVDMLAAEAKRLPGWMRGKDVEMKRNTVSAKTTNKVVRLKTATSAAR